jgi:hypothetical protein
VVDASRDGRAEKELMPETQRCVSREASKTRSGEKTGCLKAALCLAPRFFGNLCGEIFVADHRFYRGADIFSRIA